MRKNTTASVVVALASFGLFALVTLSGEAAVRPDSLFQSNMVLGRGREIVFTGAAVAGETVSVKLRGKTYSGKTGANGRYSVTVEPLPVVKDPFDVVISDGKNSVTLTNVVSGLVILAAGQSNMEVPVKKTLNPDEETASATRKVMSELPHCAFVSANGLTLKDDRIHFDYARSEGVWSALCGANEETVGQVGLTENFMNNKRRLLMKRCSKVFAACAVLPFGQGGNIVMENAILNLCSSVEVDRKVTETPENHSM